MISSLTLPPEKKRLRDHQYTDTEASMAFRIRSKPMTRRILSGTEGHSPDEEKDQDDHQAIGTGQGASLGTVRQL